MQKTCGDFLKSCQTGAPFSGGKTVAKGPPVEGIANEETERKFASLEKVGKVLFPSFNPLLVIFFPFLFSLSPTQVNLSEFVLF